jgi:calpain
MHRYGTKDGKVMFDDFLICAMKVKVMIEAFREKDKGNRNIATFTLDEWISKTIYS